MRSKKLSAFFLVSLITLLMLSVTSVFASSVTSIPVNDDSIYYFNATYAEASGMGAYERLHIDSNNVAHWYGGGVGIRKRAVEIGDVRSVYITHGQDTNYYFTYFFIKTNNELWAMGDNSRGTVGDDTGLDREKPVFIMSDVANISFGNKTVYAYKTDKSRWSWGDGKYTPAKIDDYYNPNQELFADHITVRNGNLDTYPMIELSDEITDLLGGKNNIVSSINTSLGNSTDSAFMNNNSSPRYYALTKDGTLWGWGYNGGTLGDGTIADRERPVKIAENVRRILPRYFITNSNDWYYYSDYSGGVKPMWYQLSYAPRIAFTNCLYVCSTYSNAYTDGTWFTPDGRLCNSNIYTSDYEVVTIIDDIQLPSIIKAPERPSSWAEGQVNQAIAAKLVPQPLQSGYTQTTTRAEFCALAVALYENVTGRTITERMEFNDTKDMNVQKMGALNVVSGIGNGSFAPNNMLTREQAAVMLSRLADVIGYPLSKHDATFADNRSVSSWALEGVEKIQMAGIMSGTGDNRFSPKNPYTREQSIVTIFRLFEYIVNTKRIEDKFPSTAPIPDINVDSSNELFGPSLLSSADYRKLNEFLTEAEQYPGLTEMNDDESLILFAAYVSAYQKVYGEAVDGEWGESFSKESVQAVLSRYFGIEKINHEKSRLYRSWDDWDVDYPIDGIGGVVSKWANVTNVQDLGNGMFLADADLYFIFSESWDDSFLGSVSQWKLPAGGKINDGGWDAWSSDNEIRDVFHTGTCKVMLKPYVYKGEKTWQIVRVNSFEVPKVLFQ